MIYNCHLSIKIINNLYNHNNSNNNSNNNFKFLVYNNNYNIYKDKFKQIIREIGLEPTLNKPDLTDHFNFYIV